MFLIGVLFLVPIYYIARSKGYSGGMFATVAGFLAFVAILLQMVLPVPPLGILQIALPAAVLGIVSLLKAKPGAPGKAYLRITFDCPECRESVTFRREREGLAELCPKCAELITVPRDQYSPVALRKDRRRPHGVEGEVCFDDFGHPEPAHQMQAILSDNGVPARVVGQDGGGVLPHLGVSQGYKLLINIQDWDKAVEIEKECQPADAGD